jgi:hypothetical protein
VLLDRTVAIHHNRKTHAFVFGPHFDKRKLLAIVNAEEDHAVSRKLSFLRYKVRRFRATRRTPRCEEVHNNDVPAKGREPQRTSIRRLQRKIRSRNADLRRIGLCRLCRKREKGNQRC